MIVWEGRGDLLEATGWTQVCPINAVGAMGKGLAKTMRDRYDGLYARYTRFYSPSGEEAAGNLNERARKLVHVTDVGGKVLLFCTKYHWMQPSPPELVETNLKTLSATYTALGIKRLAVPMLGCGEGRLPRDRVLGWLRHYLGGIDIPVRIYR